METKQKFTEVPHFLEKIADLTPGLITVFNVNTGLYSYVNNGGEAVLGYTMEDFLSGGFNFVVSLVHPDDVQRILDQNQQAIFNANEKYPAYNDNDAVEFEYRMKHKKGEYLWVHTYGVVCNRDVKHNVEEVLNITVDITERKNAEIKAAQSKIREDYFRDLADQSPFMIWKVNEKGLCNYVNKPWCDFTGLSFEESMDLGWGKAFHPDDAGPAYDKFMSCFNASKPYHSKFRIRTSHGEFRWVLVQSNPLQQGNGYIGSLTDITEQEQASRLLNCLCKGKMSL
jgi:two-component system, chemotaxis family, CheB/CheR fusion protein